MKENLPQKTNEETGKSEQLAKRLPKSQLLKPSPELRKALDSADASEEMIAFMEIREFMEEVNEFYLGGIAKIEDSKTNVHLEYGNVHQDINSPLEFESPFTSNVYNMQWETDLKKHYLQTYLGYGEESGEYLLAIDIGHAEEEVGFQGVEFKVGSNLKRFFRVIATENSATMKAKIEDVLMVFIDEAQEKGYL